MSAGRDGNWRCTLANQLPLRFIRWSVTAHAFTPLNRRVCLSACTISASKTMSSIGGYFALQSRLCVLPIQAASNRRLSDMSDAVFGRIRIAAERYPFDGMHGIVCASTSTEWL